MVTAKQKTKRKNARKKPAASELTFAVEIRHWSWEFWFGISNTPGISGGHYDDYRHLELDGTIIFPAKYAGRQIGLVFLPDTRLNNQGGDSHKISSVGHLSLSRSANILCSMPSDALAATLQMLIAGRFRFIIFRGAAPRYGQASLRSFRFAATMDDDDFL